MQTILTYTMKKTQLRNWMLLALVVFSFTACDNETLNKNDFVFDQEANQAGEGQFIAKVNGTDFLAESASGIIGTVSNTMVISGIKTSGEVIYLSIENPDVGVFSLTSTSGGVNGGTYFPVNGNSFLSEGLNGGTGQLEITELDQDALTVSGTFSFTAVRVQLDANGDPILDSQGNPLFETVTISEGAFNKIPYTLNDDTGGGNGGGGNGGPTDPADSFFANLDGEEFVDMEFVANQTVVGGVPMLNLIATTATGATIRIDIPEGTPIGTYDFETQISDGTDIIAIYNDGLGGDSLTPESGSITITEYGTVTGKLAASFEFVASDPLQNPAPVVVTVTDGLFNVDILPSSGGAGSTLNCEIDGVLYEPTSVEVTQEPFNDGLLITITTQDGNNQSVTLQFPLDITAGSYEMSPGFVEGDEKVGLFNPDIGNSILFTSNPGNLTILSIEYSSGVVEGLFSFTGADPLGNDPTTYDITNGTFVITLP